MSLEIEPLSYAEIVVTVKFSNVIGLYESWAAKRLIDIRNSYALSIAAASLLNTDAVLKLKGTKAFFEQEALILNSEIKDRPSSLLHLDMDQVVDRYLHQNFEHRRSIMESVNFATRNLIKEAYEIVATYSQSSGTSDKVLECSWFHLARVIRNAVAHDLRIRFSKFDRKYIPIVWRGIEVTERDDGRMLPSFGMGVAQSLALFHEIEVFVASNEIKV